MVDLDPQGNASTGLGLDHADRELSSYDLIMGEATLSDALVKTAVPGLHLVPAVVDLTGAEIELVDRAGREKCLLNALDKAQGDYDYIFIDCPPSLGILTLNALVAADAVLVPLQCEFFALEGVSQLIKTVERIKRALNPAP